MKSTHSNRYYYSETEFLNYEIVGSGPSPVIFLHGFGASLRNWDDVLPLLPKNLITAYVLDLKGAGLSSKPRDSRYSIKDNAEIVFGFIKEKQLEDYFIVGHSLGGGVALLVALEAYSKNDGIPKGMVLLDTAAYRTELPFFVKNLRIPIISNVMLALSSPEFMARYTLKRIVHDRTKVTPELVARYASCMSQKGYGYVLKETAKDIIPEGYDQLTRQYPEIKCPVLVVWGRHDSALPLSSGERLIRELPNANLKIIDYCGHNPHEEFPDTVAELIVSSFALKGK